MQRLVLIFANICLLSCMVLMILDRLNQSIISDDTYATNIIQKRARDVLESKMFVPAKLNALKHDYEEEMKMLNKRRRLVCPPMPPPPGLMCAHVAKRAAKVKVALTKLKLATEKWDKKMEPKFKDMDKAEGERREKALERANTREEEDIKERMERVKRDDMAAASERANMIELMEYMAQSEEKSKKDGINRPSNMMSDFAIMDDLDRMESGQSSYRMYAHSKDSMNEGAAYAGDRAERANAEDRGEAEQMEERNARGTHEDMGEYGLRVEFGQRGMRMDAEERNQKDVNNIQDDVASLSEKRGKEQDIENMVHEDFDRNQWRDAKNQGMQFNNIHLGEFQKQVPSDEEEAKTGSMGKQHLRDLMKPHQEVYMERQLSEGQFVPNYSDDQYYYPKSARHLPPSMLERMPQNYYGVSFDSAGNKIEVGTVADIYSSHKRHLFFTFICGSILCCLFVIYIFSFQTKNSANEPLLQT